MAGSAGPPETAFKLGEGMAQAIIAHAQEAYPQEACGLIAGRDNRGERLYRGRNVAPYPETSFELDTVTLALQLAFEEEGLELAAIYHSHPRGPASPSATDIAQAYYPGSVQIICSLATPEPQLRGFRIANSCVSEVSLLLDFDN